MSILRVLVPALVPIALLLGCEATPPPGEDAPVEGDRLEAESTTFTVDTQVVQLPED